MSSRLIRTKEATIQVSIDGVRQSWSGLIKDLSIKPDVDRAKFRHVGAKRSTGDLDIKGFDVSFKTSIQTHAWWDVVKAMMEAERNGQDMPEVSIAITYAYRGSATRTVTLHTDAILFPDDFTIPESDYLTLSWSGFFAEMD